MRMKKPMTLQDYKDVIHKTKQQQSSTPAIPGVCYNFLVKLIVLRKQEEITSNSRIYLGLYNGWWTSS